MSTLNEQRKLIARELRENFNEQTPDQTSLTEVENINRELFRLNNLIKEQKVPNKDKIKQLTQEFNAIDQQLFQFFFTDFGEVFYQALTTSTGHLRLRILGSGYGRGNQDNQTTSPVNLVLEDNNLNKGHWHISSLKSATHLYMCDLGWDCSADSPLMLEFCLFGYPTYPDSCGLNAHDFYRDIYISPNQWPDVSNFIHSYEAIFNG